MAIIVLNMMLQMKLSKLLSAISQTELTFCNRNYFYISLTKDINDTI